MLSWVPYIPGTTAQMPDAELGPTVRLSVIVIVLTVSLWNNTHGNTGEQ